MRSPFEQLDPPAGGLEQLRARLAERSNRGTRSPLWMRPILKTATALLLIFALAVVIVKYGASRAKHESNWNLEAHPAWVALGLGVPGDSAVTIRPTDRSDVALMPMLETESVVIYRVGRRVEESPQDDES